MTDKAYAVPLHELLASVPREARLVIDDDDGMGTRFIPVGRYCNEAAEALRARLAQLEQEPWGYISHKAWKMPVFVEADDLQAANLPHNNPDYTPVYKTPPQREWVGLTDEEYEAIREDGQFGKGSIRFKNLFEAIEARLREKNS